MPKKFIEPTWLFIADMENMHFQCNYQMLMWLHMQMFQCAMFKLCAMIFHITTTLFLTMNAFKDGFCCAIKNCQWLWLELWP